jgi:hypothetical protein
VTPAAPAAAMDEDAEMAAAIAKLEGEQAASMRPAGPPPKKVAPPPREELETPEIDPEFVDPDEASTIVTRLPEKTKSLGKDDDEEDEDEAPVRKSKLKRDVEARSVKSKRRRDEDEDDEDEDEDTPRSKKSKKRRDDDDAEDLDDEPPSRSKKGKHRDEDEEDEDDRPSRSRKRRDDDEEDDEDESFSAKPLKKKRFRDDDLDEDDYDDDDEPRSKKKKKKKAGSNAKMWILIGSIAGVVLIGGGVGLTLWLVFSGTPVSGKWEPVSTPAGAKEQTIITFGSSSGTRSMKRKERIMDPFDKNPDPKEYQIETIVHFDYKYKSGSPPTIEMTYTNVTVNADDEYKKKMEEIAKKAEENAKKLGIDLDKLKKDVNKEKENDREKEREKNKTITYQVDLADDTLTLTAVIDGKVSPFKEKLKRVK